MKSNWNVSHTYLISVARAEWFRVDASNDAHCALMVYKRLMELAATHGRTLTPGTFTTNLKHDYETGKLKVGSTTSAPLSRESTASSITTQSSSGTSQSSSSGPSPNQWNYPNGPDRTSPQHRRAYDMWHHRKMTMDQIRAALRSKENPLAVSTVMYVRSHSIVLVTLLLTAFRICADRTLFGLCRQMLRFRSL